jgi:hypothetical protein
MAHELGHNLGAPHDGNHCPYQDNHLMAPGWDFGATNIVNMKTFSKCSIEYMKANLLNENRS